MSPQHEYDRDALRMAHGELGLVVDLLRDGEAILARHAVARTQGRIEARFSDWKITDTAQTQGGELVAALRHALRDPNEAVEIERTLAYLLTDPDEYSAYCARDHLIGMVEHYRQSRGEDKS